jgi:Domain of unknown function (DUF4352)
MMNRAPFFSLVLLLVALGGCGSGGDSTRIDYPMGERVTVGPLTYNVIETVWRSQLGDAFKLRLPDQRFLLLTISVTNGGGQEMSVPLLTLENQSGESFRESDDGEGVDNWFGVLRTLSPAQTQQGRILFDVGLSSYRLRVSDGGSPGNERYAWVQIPLRIDTDSTVSPAMPTVPAK